MCLLLSGGCERTRALAPVANQARPARAHYECGVVRRMLVGYGFHLEPPQQHSPDHFDLLVGESGAQAAMLSPAEADERKLIPAILFAARSEAVRIVAVRLPEDMPQAMR